jgi:group I intron endonuclease
MIVYKAQNKITGKIYIGITRMALSRRIGCHLKKGTIYPFRSALHKYGIQSFEISVIDTADDWRTLCEKEVYWIAFYGCLVPNGYNVTGGGEGLSQISQSTREQISASLKLAYAQGRRIPRKGVKATRETREKLSAMRKGKPQRPDWISKRAASWVGRKHSEESKAKMREAKLGRKQTAEHIANAAATRIGKKHSPERIAKAVAARRAAMLEQWVN